MRLCGFGWTIVGLVPLVFDIQGDIYTRNNIDFSTLSHLESLGLVQFNIAGFHQQRLPKSITVVYYGRPVNLTLPLDANNSLQLGKVLFTRAGHQLAPVCGSTQVEGFFDFVYERWAGESLVPKRETEQVATGETGDENRETSDGKS
jgi:hypothetical protein